MREIKFRFYDKALLKMVYRNILPYDNEHPEIAVMQYTGFKDKNSKEIYEGDVVRQWIEDIIEPSGGFYWLAKIEFYHGAWVAKQIGFDYEKADEFPTFVHDECSLFEVIGNIKENPELL